MFTATTTAAGFASLYYAGSRPIIDFGFFMAAIGLVFFVFAHPIVGLFTKDAAAAAIAVTGLRTMSIGFPLFGAGMVLEQAFNGAGDTWTPTWINLFVYWLIQIPLAWLLAYPLAYGVNGVFVAVTPR